MDDKRFDDIIRKKAERFKDTEYDAHALMDLRKRLSSLPGKTSGWNVNRTAYLLGSMVLFTLINFSIAWYFGERRNAALNDEIDDLRSAGNQLIVLQDRLNQEGSLRTDTVYIYRDFLNDGIHGKTGLSFQPFDIWHSRAYAAGTALNPRGEQSEFYTLNAPVNPVKDYRTSRNQWLLGPEIPQFLPEVSTYQEPEHHKPAEKKEIPNRMRWALEKHNHRGVDLQFGLEGDYQKSNYDVGTGKGNAGIGFLTEVIFSPALRLETGFRFGTRAYNNSQNEVRQFPLSFFEDYPGYDEQLGEISSLESEAKMVEVPLNLKIYAPLDHNKKWYISAGLTPQWARNQEFDYKYSVQTPYPPDESEFFSYVGSNQEIDMSYYATTVNLGLGTEMYLEERLRWQFGIFYQKGLGDAGFENRQLKSSFGIKSSLWFNKP